MVDMVDPSNKFVVMSHAKTNFDSYESFRSSLKASKAREQLRNFFVKDLKSLWPNYVLVQSAISFTIIRAKPWTILFAVTLS